MQFLFLVVVLVFVEILYASSNTLHIMDIFNCICNVMLIPKKWVAIMKYGFSIRTIYLSIKAIPDMLSSKFLSAEIYIWTVRTWPHRTIRVIIHSNILMRTSNQSKIVDCVHTFVCHKCEFPMRTSGNGLKALLMLIKYRIKRIKWASVCVCVGGDHVHHRRVGKWCWKLRQFSAFNMSCSRCCLVKARIGVDRILLKAAR